MKKTQRIMYTMLSLILVVAMTMSTAVTSLAIEPQVGGGSATYNYVSLGDSMTTGFGYDDYYYTGPETFASMGDEYGNKNVRGFMQKAKEAYPAKIVEALEAEGNTVSWTQLAGNAMRINDIYAALVDEGAYIEDDFYKRVFKGADQKSSEKWFECWGDLVNKKGLTTNTGDAAVREVFQNSVKDADIITLNIGYNNFGTFFVGRLGKYIEGMGNLLPNYGKADEDTLQTLLNTMDVDINVDGVKEQIYNLVREYTEFEPTSWEKIEFNGVSISVSDFVDLLIHGYISYCYYENKAVERIYELNPDVNLVMVGMFNSQKGFKFTYKGKTIDFDQVYNGIVEMANIYTGLINSNADKYYYVDLSDKNIERLYDDLANDTLDLDMCNRLIEALCKEYHINDVLLGPVFNTLNNYKNSIPVGIEIPSSTNIEDIKAAYRNVYGKSGYQNDRQKEINKATQKLLMAVLGGVQSVTKQEPLIALSDAATLQTLMGSQEFTGLVASALGTYLMELPKGNISADEITVSLLSVFFDTFKEASKTETINIDKLLPILSSGNVESLVAGAFFGTDEQKEPLLGVLNLYVRMMLCNGMWMHPSADGHQTTANEIMKVLTPVLNGEDVQNSREYMAEKLYSLANRYAPEYSEYMFDYVRKQAMAADSAYGISNKLYVDAEKLYNSCIIKTTELNGNLKEAVKKYNESVDKLYRLSSEAYNKAFLEINNAFEKSVKDLTSLGSVAANIKNAYAELYVKLNGNAAMIKEAANEVEKNYNTAIGLAKDMQVEVYSQLKSAEAYVNDAKAKAKMLYVNSISAPYTVDKDSYYVSIGDSVMTGMGLGEDINGGEWNYGYGKKVAEAYPQVLAEKLGLNEDQHRTLGMGGIRVEDLLYILDLDAEADEYFNERTLSDIASNGKDSYGITREAVHKTFADEIGKADLVTISIGGNNFGTYGNVQRNSIEKNGKLAYPVSFDCFDNETIAEINKTVKEYKANIIEMLSKNNVTIDSSVTEKIDKAILTAEAYVYTYASFSENYADAINAVHAINPDALVAIVGLYNTLDEVYYSANGIEVNVGDIVGALVNVVNTQFLAYAMETPNTIYVDAPDVTMFCDKDTQRPSQNLADGEYLQYMDDNRGLASHPNAEGHAYMADQIYKALQLNNGSIKDLCVNENKAKAEYVEGQTFNTSGLILKATYYDGTEKKIAATECDITPSGELTTSDTSITLSYQGMTVTIPVKVVAKAVTGIEVKTAPTKVEYVEGQSFNAEGMVIEAEYNDGTKKNVALKDCTITPSGALTTSDKAVAISYEGKTVTQAITVANKKIIGITIKIPATRLNYISGQSFDPTGMVIEVSFDNGKTADTTQGFTIVPSDALKAIDKFVTINYGGFSVVQNINVDKDSNSNGAGISSYNISINKAANGDVTVSPNKAKSGTTVTVNTKPGLGYKIESIIVETVKGKNVTLKKCGSGVYTFSMPDSDVTVSAKFTTETITVTNKFKDVKETDYFFNPVLWAIQNKITTGTSDSTFSPAASCTRADMVTFLWRAAGKPEPCIVKNPFTDIKPDDYFYKAVLWAYEKGITTGTTSDKFSPSYTIDRAQAVTLMYRYANGKVSGNNNGFKDIDKKSYYNNAVQWAVDENITTGTSNTTFSPRSDCTRGQIVTFLYRYFVK